MLRPNGGELVPINEDASTDPAARLSESDGPTRLHRNGGPPVLARPRAPVVVRGLPTAGHASVYPLPQQPGLGAGATRTAATGSAAAGRGRRVPRGSQIRGAAPQVDPQCPAGCGTGRGPAALLVGAAVSPRCLATGPRAGWWPGVGRRHPPTWPQPSRAHGPHPTEPQALPPAAGGGTAAPVGMVRRGCRPC